MPQGAAAALEPALNDAFFAACPLRGGLSWRPVAAFDSLAVVACRACRLVYKRRQARDLAGNYEAAFSTDGPAQYTRRRAHRVAECRRQLLAALEWYPDAEVVVDIGCAAGYVMEAAAGLGLAARGLDCVPFAVATRHHRGLDARLGSIERLPLPEASASIVTAKHTLEHVGDPAAALAEVRRVLPPGGVFFVVVPDAAYWKRHLMPRRGRFFRPGALGWQHHIYYDTDTLARMLDAHGLPPAHSGRALVRPQRRPPLARAPPPPRGAGLAGAHRPHPPAARDPVHRPPAAAVPLGHRLVVTSTTVAFFALSLVSTRKRNASAGCWTSEHFMWSRPVKTTTSPVVYEIDALFQEGGAQETNATLLRMPLSQEAMKVLVGSALPRRVGICKGNLGSNSPPNLGVARKVEALVESDGAYHLSVGFERRNNGGRDFTSILARDSRSETEAALALYEGHDDAFVVPANDRASLPVPNDRPFLDTCASVLNSHPVRDMAPSVAS